MPLFCCGERIWRWTVFLLCGAPVRSGQEAGTPETVMQPQDAAWQVDYPADKLFSMQMDAGRLRYGP